MVTDTELLTPAECAKRTRRRPHVIRQAANSGHLKAVITGENHYRHYEIRFDDLMEWHLAAKQGRRGGARPHPVKAKESGKPNLGLALALKAASSVKWRPECSVHCPGCIPAEGTHGHDCWRYPVPRLAPADKDGDCIWWGIPRGGKPR